MALRHFPGLTEAELLAERARLVQEKLRGKVMVGGAAGDTNWSATLETSIDSRLTMVMEDLHVLNPTTYPIEDLPQDRTVIAFGQATDIAISAQ